MKLFILNARICFSRSKVSACKFELIKAKVSSYQSSSNKLEGNKECNPHIVIRVYKNSIYHKYKSICRGNVDHRFISKTHIPFNPLSDLGEGKRTYSNRGHAFRSFPLGHEELLNKKAFDQKGQVYGDRYQKKNQKNVWDNTPTLQKASEPCRNKSTYKKNKPKCLVSSNPYGFFSNCMGIVVWFFSHILCLFRKLFHGNIPALHHNLTIAHKFVVASDYFCFSPKTLKALCKYMDRYSRYLTNMRNSVTFGVVLEVA